MAMEQAVMEVFGMLAASGYAVPREIDRDTVAAGAIWAAVLNDVPDPVLKRAAVAYIRSGSEFWPKPGQLLEHARELLAAVGPRRIAVDDADAEWGRVLKERVRRGHYAASPVWEDRQIERDEWRLAEDPLHREALRQAVLAAGGWQQLGMIEPGTPTEAAARAAFRAAFRAVLVRAEQDGRAGEVLGLLEQRVKLLPGGRRP